MLDLRHPVCYERLPFVPAKWWQHLLHNQTALLIKAALLFNNGKAVLSVPYRLND